MQVRDRRHQSGLISDRRNSVEVWLQRLSSLGLDQFLVHAGRVEVADFLVEVVPFGIRSRDPLENRVQFLSVSFSQLGEARPGGLVRGKGIVPDPVAAGELIKVDARLGRFVQVVDRKR